MAFHTSKKSKAEFKRAMTDKSLDDEIKEMVSKEPMFPKQIKKPKSKAWADEKKKALENMRKNVRDK